MVSPNPKPPLLRSGVYETEVATFGDITAVFKHLIENHLRFSLTSPPLAKDLTEGTMVWDKTLLRIYIKSDGVLRYVQFT